jgi:hypothetical protein
MEVPQNVEVFKTELSTYWFDFDGILNATSTDVKRTIENTRKSFELVRKISNNRKVPLLIYVSRASVPDKQTRDFVAKELPTVYAAMAMVSKSRLGKMIMNALFRLRRPTIPMKTFSNDKEAKQWLKQFL